MSYYTDRADIGVALRMTPVFMLEKYAPALFDWMQKNSEFSLGGTETGNTGALFVFRSVKTNETTGLYYDNIVRLMNILDLLPNSWFLIIMAGRGRGYGNEECPDVDLGEWHNNPWNLRKKVTTELCYDR